MRRCPFNPIGGVPWFSSTGNGIPELVRRLGPNRDVIATVPDLGDADMKPLAAVVFRRSRWIGHGEAYGVCFTIVFPNLICDEASAATLEPIGAWDSLAPVTLAAVLWEEIGIQIDISDLPQLDLLQFIQRYLRKDGSSEGCTVLDSRTGEV